MSLKRKAPIADDFTRFDSESDQESTDLLPEKRDELLKGFESDSSDEENDVDDTRIIQLSNLTPSIKKAVSKADKATESGVLYIGHIPHGFYEEEMTSYFSQFGTLTNLRISRSKKTGNSKHYGFIEFADRGVAEIVAETMHNYLLAGRLLQVILLTPEEYKKKGGRELFKGAGRKFKTIPWATISKRRVEESKTKERWAELQKRENKRRSQRKSKIAKAGIEYDF